MDRGRSESVVYPSLDPTRTPRPEIPQFRIWCIVILTAVGMSFLNVGSVWTMRFLVEWKFDSMQAMINAADVPLGIVTLIGIVVTFATAATLLIHCVGPASAGGSGAPENKGWLNGNELPDFFTVKSLVVRAIAVILGNSAGYPVGREGPSVTMGSNLAFLLTKPIVSPYLRKKVNIDVGHSGLGPARAARVDDFEGLRKVQRLAGAVGGACAMTMIFDAPIGGVLYMFEEITVDSWPIELTWLAFVGTQINKMTSYFLLGLMGKTIKDFVIFDFTPENNSWTKWDVPVVIVLAFILGPFSAFHTRAALQVGSIRQKVHERGEQPRKKMIEAVLFAAFCALLYALVSLLAKCNKEFEDMPFVARHYVRYNCEEGAYNPVASLLLTTSEGAVKRLFSRKNTGDIEMYNTFLACVTYTIMNISLTGIPVPSGNFTGTMLIGALVGRIMGAMVQHLSSWAAASKMEDVVFAAPGIYAMVGSAAMLSGFKQIALGSVVFILEVANDLSLTPLLMLSVSISLLLNRNCLKHLKCGAFDEEQIKRKKVPYLPPEPPTEMAKMVAEKLCEDIPDCARLGPTAPVRRVRQALDTFQGNQFPVIHDDGTCLGYTTRERLNAALDALGSIEGMPSQMARSRRRMMTLEDQAMVADALEDSSCELDTLPVERLTDPVTFMIPMDVQVSRFYLLFSKVGAAVVFVVTEKGEFHGLISRLTLIDQARKADEESDEDDDMSPSGSDE